jgi:hypothetical protein
MSYFDRSKYLLKLPATEHATSTADTPQAQSDNKQGRFADTVDSFQAGAISGAGGIVDFAAGLFDWQGGADIAQKFYGWSDAQTKQMSQRGRDAMGKSFFEDDGDGGFKAGEGLTDFDTWLLTIANVAGQFVPTAIPGAGAAGAVTKAAKLGAKGKAVATSVAMGATGGSAATGQGMEQARDEVRQMPQGILDNSPLYNNLVDALASKNPDLSDEELKAKARAALEKQVAKEVMTDPASLVANFAASAIGDPIIGKALLGARIGKGALGSMAKGFVAEGSTEAVQAGTQQYGINKALQPVDNRDLMKGVTAAALNEGIAGGGFGGGAGLLGGLINRNQPVAEEDTPPPANSGSILDPGNAPVVSGGDMNLPPDVQQEIDPAVAAMAESNPGLASALNRLDQAAAARRNDTRSLLDIPTAARKAGFGNSALDVGRFGDMLTSPVQQSLDELRSKTIADMVNDAQGSETPTPLDRFSPVPYQYEGEVLRQEKQPVRGLPGATIDGEQANFIPDNRMEGEYQQPIRTQQHIQGIADKGIIFGNDNRAAQQARERADNAMREARNQPARIPQKDIVFAGNETGVTVKQSGQPFKSPKEALASKTARTARKAGAEIEAVPFADGFGWQVVEKLAGTNSQQSDLTNEKTSLLSDQAVVTASPETDTAPQAVQDAQAKPAIKGKKARTYTPSTNKPIDVEYRVVEADSLVTSNDFSGAVNPDYPAEMQPRNRSRQAYQVQVNNIAKNPIADKLLESPDTDRGAPVVRNGIVESGNGRSIGLREAYRTGKGEQYKQALIARAEQLGLDPAQLAGMKQPVLVRERMTELSPAELREFTVDSNQSAGVEQSPAELARTDASLIDDSLMTQLAIPENGDVLSPMNDRFVRGFAAILGNNEVASYKQADGQWNKAFKDRLLNAIFAKGYDSADLLSSISESTNPESKNLLSALMNVAGKLGAIRSMDADIARSLSGAFTEAAGLVTKARREGTTIDAIDAQADMLTGHTDADIVALAKELDGMIRSGKRMTALLDDIATTVLTDVQNMGQTDIFTGAAGARPNVNEVIRNATGQQQQADTAGTPGLFDGPENGRGNTAEQQRVSQDTEPSQSESQSSEVNEITPEIKAAAEKALYEALDNEFENVTSKNPGLYLFEQFQIENPQLAMRIANRTKYNKDELIEGLASAAGFTNTDRVPGLLESIVTAPDAWAKSFLAYYNGEFDRGNVKTPLDEEQNNQTPADAGVSVSDAAESKPTKRTEKLQDVGAILIANKKSWFSGKGIKWSDIAGENDTLKLKLATKSKIWSKPNWDSIINSVPDAEQDTFAPIVHMVKQVYDAISTKPNGKSDQNIQDYIEVVTKVKDAAESLLNDKQAQAKLWAELGARAERRLASPYSIGTMATKSDMAPIFAKVFPIVAGGSRFKRGERENDLAGQLGSKAVKAIQFDAGTAIKALQDISKGWPAKQESWQKQGYAVIELDGKPEPTVGEIKRPDGTVYSARVSFKSVDGATFREFLGTFDNKQEADQVAKAYAAESSKPVLLVSKRKSIVSAHDDVDSATEAARAITRRNTGGETKEQPLQAEDIERVGVERRQGGRDATAQELMDSFGFTGVNFGNWVKGDERQWFVNQAYDSFYDLAETLSLPPKAMSLNGMLGIAFGAQGNSGAAAHFVPGFNEINLTKNTGAGALAHEWGHALDHYFGVMSGMARTEEPFASELPNLDYRSKQTVKAKLDTPNGIRQVIHDAFVDITSQLKSKLETMEQYQARIKASKERYAAEFNDFVKPFEGKLSAKGKAALDRLRSSEPGEVVSIPPPKGKKKSPGVVYDEVMKVANDLPAVFSDLRMIDALNNKAAMVKLSSERVEVEPSLAKIHTDFYAKSRGKDASKGGKVYWSTPVEMFARAFESYVMDQMAEKGQRNDFLVRPGKEDLGETNPEYPYPAGIERQDFNAAFNKLIDAIETKNADDGKVILFSKTNTVEPGRKPTGARVSEIERMAEQFMKKLNGASGIKVKVYRNQDEARLDWNMSLDGKTVKGAYNDKTKTAYLIAGNFNNIAEARRTLAHEVIAHGGLQSVIGAASYKRFIDRIKQTRSNKAFAKHWAHIDKNYTEADSDTKAEELFAKFVESQPDSGSMKYWWQALVRWLNNQLANLGITQASDPDMDVMRDMMDSIVQGFKRGKAMRRQAGKAVAFDKESKNSFVITEQEAIEQGYDMESDLYSGTNSDDLPMFIQRGPMGPIMNNVFDGIFASSKNVAHSHGDNLQRFVIKTEIAESRDLNNEDAVKFLQDYFSLDNLTAEEFEALSSAIIFDEQIGYDEDYSDLMSRVTPFDDIGEQSWEMQRIRGQLARHLGFDAVAMKDEHGASVLLVGDGVRRIANDGELKFNQTTNTSAAKDKLGLGEQADETLKEKATARYRETADTLKSTKFWQRLNEGIFDGMSGIKNAEESVGVTDPNQQGYVSARLASGLADVLHGVFHYGAPEWRDGVIARKANTKGLLEVFGMLGDDLNDWLAWMGANRAEKLMAEGRERNLTAEDIAELKALADGKETLFEQVRQEYNKINSAIIDVAQQAGLISDAQRSGFDEEWYVPFFRDLDVDPEMQDIAGMVQGPKTTKGIANQSAKIKALKGGKQSTKDLLENIIQRHSTLIDASLKNHAMLEIVGNLDGTDYMQSVDSPDIVALSQADLNKLGRVKVMRDGKAEAYVVSDPALLRGLLQINDAGSKSLFRKYGRSAKRFLTAGITLSPDFIFKNFVRDAAHAWMVNKDEFKFGRDSVAGLKKAFKEDEAYRNLIFSGAAFQGGYVHGSDPEAGAQQIRRALRDKGLTTNQITSYMDSLVTKGSQLIEKYRGVSDKVENANRLSTYEAALKAGKSNRQAAFEAKDLMDYSLKGNFGLIGTMVDVLPFFNARLQGLSKLVRAAKGSDRDRVLKVLSANLAMKGLKVAAFSLALAGLNDDDERYQELPDWDKDANWHFWLGDDHFRIPKPFELGIIFGTLPERMFNYGMGNQNNSDLGKAVGHAVFNTLALNPIPQLALPAVEVMVNKSFFKGSPIEGMGDLNRESADRYNIYTSETAKQIGQLFNVSPKKVEHLIHGYTGTIGGYVLGASDIMARQMLGIESANTPAGRYPVVKAFYQGSAPKGSTKFADEFYQALEGANQAYGSYKRAAEEGDIERVKSIVERNSTKLRSRALLNKLQRSLNDMSKQTEQINNSDKLTGAQKREAIDAVTRQKNALYHAAYVKLQLGEW